ncbi:MAG: CoB--CoM heterodisulfide reductase iron-sulfur subunit B family protein [Candidatus Bathyarchaeia archaeon]
MKSAYFPGCSLLGTAKEYDLSNRAVFRELGVELPEVEDWSCCGSTATPSYSRLLSLVLPARNLALAERMGSSIVAPCAACFNRLAMTNLSLREDGEMRDRVNEVLSTLNLNYNGKVEVRHLLDFYLNEIDLETLSKHVVKPLDGLRAVPYYGCLTVRPKTINTFDDTLNPSSLDQLIDVTGAECLEWMNKTKCCGASLIITKEDVALKLTKGLLLDAERVGAQCIVVACPFCHFNLDAKQGDVKRMSKKEIPILYFTQLLGLALGIDWKELALDKNSVSPFGMLRKWFPE